MASIWAELKRRNVVKVAAAYAAVAWLVLQLIDVLVPLLDLPDWVGKLLFLFLLVGFPVALLLAWAYELTPEGLKKEAQVHRDKSITAQTGRKLNFIIIGVLVVAVVFFSIDKFVWDGTEEVAKDLPKSHQSIAVLPFANRSAVAEDAFFVDGVHDDILSQLSRISALKVISRTSVERFRDTDRSMQEIGQALGVARILLGAVQRAGDRVRINVQLIDATTDEHIWAATYDRHLTAANIFAIQSEVAVAIVSELRATLSPEEENSLAKVPTESLPALEAYFLGRQLMATEASEPLAKAEQYFRRAIDLDPEFALAHVALANTYLLQMRASGLPRDEQIAKAEAVIERALELDDQLSEAYSTLAQLRQRDKSKMEAALVRALELNPNNAEAHRLYSWLLSTTAQFERALTYIETAIELDPLSPRVNLDLAWMYLDLGWWDKAMQQFKNSIKLDPDVPMAYDGVGSIYRRVYGRLDKAVPWYEKVVEVDPGNSNALVWLGLLVLDLGDIEKAEYWINRSLDFAPDGYDTHIGLQILHVYRGDKNQASEYAQKILSANPREWSGRIAAAYLRDRELEAGQYAAARERYAKAFPELFDEKIPEIDKSNYGAAINVAPILFETGEKDRAIMLLRRGLAFLETIERLGYSGYWVTDVQAYALLGETSKALAALREAIDSGWRSLWWYYLEHDKCMESLRDNPEFQAMLAEVKSDISAQRERMRKKAADTHELSILDVD